MSQNFELAEIYDDTDASVYACGDEAVTILQSRSVCIIRPWTWNAVTSKGIDEAPETMKDGIRKLLSAPVEWQHHLELGELVIWASRRTRRDAIQPYGDDDSAFIVGRRDIDPQPVGNRVFNRRLIREVCQAFIENYEGYGGMGEPVKLCIRVLDNGYALQLSHDRIRAFVMSFSGTVEPGDERMPLSSLPPCACQWEPGDSPCPVHGMDDE